ncbi:hypothetical protein DVH24_024126 [Malus domestica]|uniref:Uncharacterized protein n=1 Tax=Malus domestica TaxID=3750 RepID=A0A498JLF6_MALDO|nr:hypothetical protein DVH24_024126 [Malus domestica]
MTKALLKPTNTKSPPGCGNHRELANRRGLKQRNEETKNREAMQKCRVRESANRQIWVGGEERRGEARRCSRESSHVNTKTRKVTGLDGAWFN